MQTIKTTEDIKKLGTILGIWAHPDDETFSMGGIMAAAVRNGQAVACITATRGELGIQDEMRWPSKRLGAIREQELHDAFGILGVHHHHWLGYPDGGCKQVSQAQAVERIAEYIRRYQPDSIFSFGPDGLTGHDDHITTSLWALTARDAARSAAQVYHAIQTDAQYQSLRDADQRLNIFFNIEKPRTCAESACAVCFELPDVIYEQKMRALKAMPSQTDAMLTLFGDDLRAGFGTEAFVRA